MCIGSGTAAPGRLTAHTGFRLIDDDFLNACFDGYIEGTELLLRIILDRRDIRVKQVQTQRQMKNLAGHDVRLDIDAVDSEGREIDIEVQRADSGAVKRRARYYSSILDAHLLKPGETYDQLPETYVVFITENDVLGAGLPLYTIDRQITNLGISFDDGEHILYVNGAARNDSTELGKLMQDFFCTDPDDMHFPELAEKARYFKQDEEGVATMCKAMEDMRKDTVRAVALRMLQAGKYALDEIAEMTGLTMDEVQALATEKTA